MDTVDKKFTQKIAKDIAMRSFAHVLDCVLGYSDTGYDLNDKADTFEQNFEEDLQSIGFKVTSSKIKAIYVCYEKLVAGFEKSVRKKYYSK